MLCARQGARLYKPFRGSKHGINQTCDIRCEDVHNVGNGFVCVMKTSAHGLP
ncbi:hypothetical protein HMPREF3232_01262 [Fannyhessea vaginae]|nr:hypothetical protein HMPREF3232_01262 [Fannyhessea vaginae]